MDIGKIIPLDFRNKVRKNLPVTAFNRPETKKSKERILPPSCFDLLIKQKTLEGIIQILKRAESGFPEKVQRYSYHAGLNYYQWGKILEQKVKETKPFQGPDIS